MLVKVMDSTAIEVAEAIDVCFNEGIINKSQNLKWTYTKCKTGSFSSVFKIHFYYSDYGEKEGGVEEWRREEEPRVKTVVCKRRLSSVSESDDDNPSIKDGGIVCTGEDILQGVSLEVQKYLSNLGLSPAVLFTDLQSGFEIQEGFGTTKSLPELDIDQVASLLARVHQALDDFSKSSQIISRLPLTWTGMLFFRS